MKTLQETFDEIIVHMRAMGRKPAIINDSCVYRLPNGDQGCFVGRLIPNNAYTSEMENKVCYASPVSDILRLEGYDANFCRIFQTIHDTFKPERWEDAMGMLARDMGIEYYTPINHKQDESFISISITDIGLISKGFFEAFKLRAKLEKASKKIKDLTEKLEKVS